MKDHNITTAWITESLDEMTPLLEFLKETSSFYLFGEYSTTSTNGLNVGNSTTSVASNSHYPELVLAGMSMKCTNKRSSTIIV